MTMLRVHAALIASVLSLAALPTAASAGCLGCSAPSQPCYPCYQPQVMPPEYRAVQETVMVEPGRLIAHRIPGQYSNAMTPQTVMVAPEAVEYERVPPRYAVRELLEMVAPASTYDAPIASGCSPWGYGCGQGYAHGYGYRY